MISAEALAAAADPGVISPLDGLIESEAARRLHEEVAKLPGTQREAVEALLRGECIEGISRGAFNSRLRDARKRLKVALADIGG